MFADTGRYAFSLCKGGRSHIITKLIWQNEGVIRMEPICERTMGEETGSSIILSDQIYWMDCMELVPQMPDGYVSMILTGPPYGISYQNNFTNSRHQVLDGDEGIDYELFAHESYRILKDNAHYSGKNRKVIDNAAGA